MSKKIPRSSEDDYSLDIIRERQKFIEEHTQAKLDHTRQFSFDPAVMSGNIENMFGVAQVPIGLAGPLLVNGEHAKGEFYVPMATVEGTMLASYNRGMRVIRESGGVMTTVSGEAMQRAPVFVFPSAREARDFDLWLDENFERIKAVAESTTSVGKLNEIEHYHAHNMVFHPLRLQYGRCCRAEHDQQGDLRRLRMDQQGIQVTVPLPAVGELRYGEENIFRQPAQGTRQASHRGDHHSPRSHDQTTCAYRHSKCIMARASAP